MTKGLENMNVVLWRHDGKTTASIAELRLFATSDSDSGALASLEEKRKAMFSELEAAGLLDELRAELEGQKSGRPRRMVAWPAATAILGPSQSAFSIGQSALKALVNTLVVAAVIGGTVVLGGSVLIGRAEVAFANARLIVSSQKIGGREFWGDLEAKLNRNAEPQNDMPEANKQRLLSNLRVLVNRARPFVHEVMLVFADPEALSKNGAGLSK